MKNIAIINAVDISAYGLEKLNEVVSSFDKVLEYAAGLADVGKILILCGTDFPKDAARGYNTKPGDNWNVAALLDCLAAESSGYDHMFYFFGDTPFLDPEKTGEMYEKHIKYLVQYSFADGYPAGLTPEILRSDCLPSIAQLAKDMAKPIKRDSVFEAIKMDINAFDIETDIAARDQRMLRVALAADTRRNFMLLKKIAASGEQTLQKACDFLEAEPETLRTLPAYFLIQTNGGCPQACSYCPWPDAGGNVLSRSDEMSAGKFLEIAAKAHDFAGDATIGLSLWGEPAFHSEISPMVRGISAFDGLSCLVETSGIGWRPGVIEEIIRETDHRLEWIVSLDALEPELYTQIRGEGYEEANRTALQLIELAPEQVHIQAVRMKDTEEKLQGFYRHWKQYTNNIIIQKYNYFGGILPDRKVTDLSPLKRHSCWHLKRDINVLLDGSVPVCKEDIYGKNLIGNVFEDSFGDIWARGNDWHSRHLSEDYPEICKGCDEYYTYNF
ncbi:MAG: spiro-SPASM protein [Spirochaetales bacterium]|jgi:spiro-SPASM protein|nr:spiro-SPASM protein [Spirochaetales bacterium]